VTGIGDDAQIPGFDIASAEQMYGVLRTQVDVVLAEGAAVLNAGDPLVARMASLCDGDVVFYDTGAGQSVIDAHLATGRRAVLVRGGRVVLATGDRSQPVADVARIELGDSAAQGPGRLDDLLAAIASAWALGISPDLIRTGIETLCATRSESSESVVA